MLCAWYALRRVLEDSHSGLVRPPAKRVSGDTRSWVQIPYPPPTSPADLQKRMTGGAICLPGLRILVQVFDNKRFDLVELQKRLASDTACPAASSSIRWSPASFPPKFRQSCGLDLTLTQVHSPIGVKPPALFPYFGTGWMCGLFTCENISQRARWNFGAAVRGGIVGRIGHAW
jgi:hypothetical protein